MKWDLKSEFALLSIAANSKKQGQLWKNAMAVNILPREEYQTDLWLHWMKTWGNATEKAKEILLVVLHGKNSALGRNGHSGIQLGSCQGKDRTDTFSLHLQVITQWPFGALEAVDIVSAVVVEVSQPWPVRAGCSLPGLTVPLGFWKGFEELVAVWGVCVRADGKGKDSFAKALAAETSSIRLC